ncbi:hypothetical protein DACRYDRAFT_51544 [Dacryopinax primogenitus]|uniref:GOLD domain-containing protein n=1 Tax=Dacryopinax primogenitus (strain DJM 731) TaxID=1858805 RepID=M5GDG8_DACPD|nr:uncharacterized protein DACRYDRAFT_51544 [Dacryopinax primogenitus]EJU02383.1 hypothetical protein DACRYDRAFT_51544 [Dacryopinax primogenitus]
MLMLLILGLSPLTEGIKFDLPGVKYPTEKCIWNHANENVLVIVTANVAPGPDQRVDVSLVDGSDHQNVYLMKRNVRGETRLAITTHAEGDLGVCFTNTLDSRIPVQDIGRYSRAVDLDVDIGEEAIDYNAIANQESLSGLEVEMRKLEGMVREITDEMAYLKRREIKMRDTNESTNRRVQNFSLFTVVSLIGLGVWQIFHLRAFFRRKYLID